MINTEVCLYVKRAEIELEHVHQKLRLLLALTEDNGVEDCIDTTEKMLEDARETAKDAAKNIDNWGSSLWLLLYRVEEEQKAAAAAEAAKTTTTVTVKAKPADDGAFDEALSKVEQSAKDAMAHTNQAAAFVTEDSNFGNEFAGFDSAGTIDSKTEGGKLNG